MPSGFRNSAGTDFDDVFDLFVQGDKGSATGYRSGDGNDLNQRYALTLRNSALTYLEGAEAPNPTASVTLDKATLDRINLRELSVPDALRNGSLRIEGDAQAVTSLFSMLDSFDGNFDIVTPRAAP